MFFIQSKTQKFDLDNHIPLSLSDDTFPEPVSLCYDKGYARIDDIIPAVRDLCDSIDNNLIQKTKLTKNIPCKKGCCECCKYFVPVSTPEAMRLVMEVEKFSETAKNYIKNRFFQVSREILSKKPPSSFRNIQNSRDANREISDWYKSLNIPCPFLYEGSCMIYEFRPLSCRQYFVTTNRCGGIGHTEKLISPVNLSQILSLTTSRLTKTAPQAIMLPLIFAWQQENQHLFEKHYPSKEMAGIFVETLCNTEHITV